MPVAGAIAETGVYPSLERSDVPVPMIAARDIAAVVARELVESRTRGVLHLHAARHYTFQEVATALGRAIGMPDLRHMQVAPAQARAVMLQAGMPPEVADRMAEMASWLTEVRPGVSYWPLETVPTTLEAFAPRFREVYESFARSAVAKLSPTPSSTQAAA